MKFVITPNPTFARDVQLSTPEGVISVPFVFKYKNKKQLDSWLDANKNTPTAAALLEVIDSWGVQLQDGTTAPVTKENMQELFNNYQASASEILAAYFDALRGSRAKNS